MLSLVRDAFAEIYRIIGVTAVDNTADAVAINGRPITFQCVTGNIWINPKATAVADATALKLVAGQSIDMVVRDNLSIISDGVGGTYQIVFWEN